jgi:DNA polymerase III subunit chi
VLFLTDGASSARIADYAMVVEMFDGNDQAAVAAARARWTAYKAEGHDLTYWRQDDAGRWAKQG